MKHLLIATLAVVGLGFVTAEPATAVHLPDTRTSTPALTAHQKHVIHLRNLAAKRAARLARTSEIARALAWARSSDSMRVKKCESGNDYTRRARTGKYQGAWQADPAFWRSYGGLRFAPNPDAAAPWQQDLVAYRGYKARGWAPWTCARLVGII